MEGSFSPLVVGPLVGAVVVVGLFVIAALRRRRGRQVDQWAHAAYSLWTGGEDCATWSLQAAQDALSSWYCALDSNGFADVIADLRKGTTGNEAWDRVRALDLLRIGIAADYIQIEDCRRETAAIGRELQGRYQSWQDLAIAFEAGMRAWQASRGTTDPGQLNRVQRNLPKLQEETWPKIAFNTPLASPDD